jgi:CheY-like chemotaxis protein
MNFQFHEDGFQFVQCQMMLAVLNAVKRLVRDTGPFGELRVRKLPAFFSQELRQLPVQIALHARKVTKTASRMRDDFPLQQSVLFVKSANRAVHGMTANPKILIVEDEIPVAMMMVFLLTRAKIKTAVAATGKKAMLLAKNGNFDLITLDVDLPDGNGFEICSRLKENARLCDTPIVFVSGRPCEQDVRRGLEAGAVDYITKPFDALDFAPRLLSHIRT